MERKRRFSRSKKKRRTATEKKTTDPIIQHKQRYICDELVLSILSRLPLKRLLRLRTVSQAWNDMIKKSDFIPDLNPMSSSKNCSLIYMPDGKSETTTHQQVFTIVRENNVLPPRNLVFPLPGGSGGYSILGVCKGLICLEKASVIYIWNPAINILRTVPPAPLPTDDYANHVFGFGFSQRSNDYRVIKIVYFQYDEIERIEMYSLATNSWKKVKRSLKEILWSICSYSGVFHQGSIYWLALPSGRSHWVRPMLLKFNLDTGTYRVYEFLHGFPILNAYRPELAVVDEFLVLLTSIKHESRLYSRVYVLNISQSSRQHHVSLVQVVVDGRNKRRLMTSGAGQVILEDIRDRRLFACDCHYDGNYFRFGFRDLRIYNTTATNFHVISLVETLKF